MFDVIQILRRDGIAILTQNPRCKILQAPPFCLSGFCYRSAKGFVVQCYHAPFRNANTLISVAPFLAVVKFAGLPGL